MNEGSVGYVDSNGSANAVGRVHIKDEYKRVQKKTCLGDDEVKRKRGLNACLRALLR